jgi:hypothetical protein
LDLCQFFQEFFALQLCLILLLGLLINLPLALVIGILN